MGELFFSLSSYEREIDKWKKLFKYYSSNVHEPFELLLRFLRTSYNSISWRCPGMLKSRSDTVVVSNR